MRLPICDGCLSIDEPENCTRDQKPSRFDTECSYLIQERQDWLNSDEYRREIEMGY